MPCKAQRGEETYSSSHSSNRCLIGFGGQRQTRPFCSRKKRSRGTRLIVGWVDFRVGLEG
jgi:hypothetical protein